MIDLMEEAGITVVLARFHRRAVEQLRRDPDLDHSLLELMTHRPSDAAIQIGRDFDQSDGTEEADGDG